MRWKAIPKHGVAHLPCTYGGFKGNSPNCKSVVQIAYFLRQVGQYRQLDSTPPTEIPNPNTIPRPPFKEDILGNRANRDAKGTTDDQAIPIQQQWRPWPNHGVLPSQLHPEGPLR